MISKMLPANLMWKRFSNIPSDDRYPWKSNAFAISRKLGLDEHIIEGAADQIDESVKDFETILADLEKSNRRLKRAGRDS